MLIIQQTKYRLILLYIQYGITILCFHHSTLYLPSTYIKCLHDHTQCCDMQSVGLIFMPGLESQGAYYGSEYVIQLCVGTQH